MKLNAPNKEGHYLPSTVSLQVAVGFIVPALLCAHAVMSSTKAAVVLPGCWLLLSAAISLQVAFGSQQSLGGVVLLGVVVVLATLSFAAPILYGPQGALFLSGLAVVTTTIVGPALVECAVGYATEGRKAVDSSDTWVVLLVTSTALHAAILTHPLALLPAVMIGAVVYCCDSISEVGALPRTALTVAHVWCDYPDIGNKPPHWTPKHPLWVRHAGWFALVLPESAAVFVALSMPLLKGATALTPEALWSAVGGVVLAVFLPLTVTMVSFVPCLVSLHRLQVQLEKEKASSTLSPFAQELEVMK